MKRSPSAAGKHPAPVSGAISLDSTIPKTHHIAETRKLTEQVGLIRVAGTFGAKAGQFAMVWLPGLDEFPLSIADDDGEHVTFAFFAVGEGTKALAALKKGDLIGLRGPFGTHYRCDEAKRVVVVAGGYGSAPMRFAAKTVVTAGAQLDVIVGAKTEAMLIFIEELKALKPASMTIMTDDGSAGRKGFVTDALEELLVREGKTIDWVFTCGPEKMLTGISAMCHAHGVRAQLSTQRYFKCGNGMCGSCVVDPIGIRLCQEGPVLDNDTFRAVSEFGAYRRDGLGRKQNC